MFSSARGAVLPAILVASTVFSGLTLPFFYHSRVESAEPVEATVELPFLNAQLQPILVHQNRDLTIRYIGGAIVLSVAAGMTTLELQRRWHAAVGRRRQQTATTVIDQTSAPACAFSPTSLAPTAGIHPAPIDPAILELDSLTAEPERGWLAELIASSADADRMAWPDVDGSEQAAQLGQIIERAEELPTCQIWSTDQHRRLLAIQFEGQYYSFFRLCSSRQAAWETAESLSAKHHLIITQADQMYALWVLQPEAQLASLFC